MSEKIDTINAAIAEIESKRAVLENALNALKLVQSSGALGTPVDGIMTSVPLPASGMGSEVPDGAFHGKSVPAAIKLYLGIVRKKQTAREISDGLQKGGVESTSKWFDKIIYSTLDRLRRSGEILKLGGHWGLPEWYPASIRAGLSEGGKSPKKARKGARRSAKSKTGTRSVEPETTKLPSPIPTEGQVLGLMTRIDTFLRENPKQHTAEDVSEALQITNVKVARMMLGKLVLKGKAQKTEDGKFQFTS
ncbi:MAG TPA: hypothetical protein VMX16_05445 [Terriglobia bacterium]|nr:hypothetical protein [Terriglobia bacterium]